MSDEDPVTLIHYDDPRETLYMYSSLPPGTGPISRLVHNGQAYYPAEPAPVEPADDAIGERVEDRVDVVIVFDDDNTLGIKTTHGEA